MLKFYEISVIEGLIIRNKRGIRCNDRRVCSEVLIGFILFRNWGNEFFFVLFNISSE